jgi:hypothetical protein
MRKIRHLLGCVGSSRAIGQREGNYCIMSPASPIVCDQMRIQCVGRPMPPEIVMPFFRAAGVCPSWARTVRRCTTYFRYEVIEGALTAPIQVSHHAAQAIRLLR